eukprot:7416632-Pyramimonas_sp.AAC.1
MLLPWVLRPAVGCDRAGGQRPKGGAPQQELAAAISATMTTIVPTKLENHEGTSNVNDDADDDGDDVDDADDDGGGDGDDDSDVTKLMLMMML